MKSFLTIRGNLLLINLVVIGLVLWLAISFLHIAVMQRYDALRLQTSLDIEKIIFHATNALAKERDIFDNYLHSPDKPTSHQVEQLKAAGLESDTILGSTVALITNETADDQIFKQLPTKRTILQEQVDSLKKHQQSLIVYRENLLSRYLKPDETSLRASRTELFDTQTDAIADLVKLATSLKYLPNYNATTIAHHHELLIELLVVNVELASKNTALNKATLNNREVSPDEQLLIAVLSHDIDRRLANIVSLTKTSDSSSRLLPIAAKALHIYRKNYAGDTRISGAGIQSQYSNQKALDDWRIVMSDISGLTIQLTDETHQSIETLVDDYGVRAYRNLVIDIILVSICFVITFASVAINRKVKLYAFHDSLTNLPNRRHFESTIKNTSESSSQMQAVIFLDLDRFKSINDNYGHSIGDELLMQVASRLLATCTPAHLLARMGGDEFAVYIDDVESEDTVEAMAYKMVAAVNRDIVVRDLTLNVGASAGVCISPLDCKGGTELLKNSDIAMYHSKTNKVNSVNRFTREMAADYHQRLQLETDLRKAVENNDFHLSYQPKVCTTSGEVKGVEALLRWSHAERGSVSPAQFIPVAEDTKLMSTIGLWALNEACREISLLQKTSLPQLQVAVNISAQQFSDVKFVDSVYHALDRYGLDHKSLELEVTESLVMHDVKRVVSMLNTLRNSGIKIAIDDFGTGYSSLQYLQELPLDTLKIDRAFILALDDSDPFSSVANSIVQLAKLFNLETVAEGVETDDQEYKIKSLGVHHIQGYLYSRPVTADELPAAIQNIGEKIKRQQELAGRRAA